MRIKELFAWAHERHQIYLKRKAGKSKPWTKDKIMQQYRFCNVYRELDTVTLWITNNWREPYKKDIDLWFALTVARFVNWPETLAETGYPAPWDARAKKKFKEICRVRKTEDQQVFTGAYMVRSRAMDKAVYLADHVFEPLWKDRKEIVKLIHLPGTKLQHVHERLMAFEGMGNFMAAQVIADLKYVAPLDKAPDWKTWAASGPGSRRGLNRVLGLPIQRKVINYARHPETRSSATWDEGEWLRTVQVLQKELAPLLRKAKMPEFHAQDVQSCLCEFDKYERVRLNEGRPRSLYPGV